MNPGTKFKKLIAEDSSFASLSSYKVSELTRRELVQVAKHLYKKHSKPSNLYRYASIPSVSLRKMVYDLM